MRWSIWSKLAAAALIVAAGNTAIAFLSDRILHDGGFDIWNLMSVAILAVVAVILFAVGHMRNKR